MVIIKATPSIIIAPYSSSIIKPLAPADPNQELFKLPLRPRPLYTDSLPVYDPRMGDWKRNMREEIEAAGEHLCRVVEETKKKAEAYRKNSGNSGSE